MKLGSAAQRGLGFSGLPFMVPKMQGRGGRPDVCSAWAGLGPHAA